MSPISESAPPLLPPGYELVRELAAGPTARVLHAARGGREVCLRIASGEADAQASAELAVLGRIDHPGLARLVDFGSYDAGRRSYVARTWIPGTDLRAWRPGRDARAIGAAFARIADALQHLHERDFVHADLKLENVIVGDDGLAVVTDFGLAHRIEDARDLISGSLYTVAPEVLLGLPPTPRSDLFSLGAMLHELLVGRRVTARELYAHFPARPFLEAARSSADELPDWSRALVASLVSRDPARRPSSAAAVAQTLRARLDLRDGDASRDPARARLSFSPLEGRVQWAEDWIDRLGERTDSARRPQAFAFATGEDAQRVFDELRYRLALRRVPAFVLDLGARTQSGAALRTEQLADEALARAHEGVLFLALPERSQRAREAADFVARTWLRRRESQGAGALLVVRSSARGEELHELWDVVDVPDVSRAAIEGFLARELEGASEGLALSLAEAAEGSAARTAELLERAAERGAFVLGERKPRWQPPPGEDWLVASASLDPAQLARMASDELALLAALEVLEASAPLGALRELLDLDETRFAAACASLAAAGWIRIRRRAGAVRIEASARDLELPSERIGEARWRELHARRAQRLAAQGAPLAAILPHRLRAEPSHEARHALVEESRKLRQTGKPELALEMLRRADAFERRRTRASDAALVSEMALDWAALGQPERAEELLETLPASESRSALAEEARAWIELARRNHAAAAQHFERAVQLAGGASSAPLWNHALALYEARRFDELERLFAELDSGARTAPGARDAWNLGMIRELVLFRRGDVERARALLAQRVESACALGDADLEAAVRANLATVERRRGLPELAARELERAIELCEKTGNLPNLAQTRALLGGTRRDMGELLLAEPALASALSLRERLGDVAGARAVRGMLGLLYADRGKLRAGIDELAASARALRESARANDAAVLDARRDELAARIGGGRTKTVQARSEKELALEADPRILVSRARAAWLARDPAAAREYAERARSLAERLSLQAEAEEARFLLHGLARFAGEGDGSQGELRASSPRVREDHDLLLLASAPAEGFDAAAAIALARELGRRGRDDRAARLAMAVARRASDVEIAREAAELARSWLASCVAGLTSEESQVARGTLLGFPDPWPEDLDVAGWRTDAEWDMTALSLLEINHRLVAQQDLPALLDEIVRSALAVAKAERGFLVLEEQGELSFDTARDSCQGDIAEPELEVSRSAIQRALETMRPLRLSNAVDDPLLGEARSVAELDLRSVLCVPFEAEEGLRGAIYVDHRLREGAFDERTEELVRLLADQAALAIRQVRRVEEIRRLNAELSRKVVDREADLASARRELERAGAVVPASGLVGSSPAMRRVHELIGRAARSSMPVLVAGASGTGKELAARALHELSPRKDGPFVSENCAALPATLIESELFGAKKGAFTGAERDREGMFERAHGGTIFLDEIGELPLELQAKLLRVLETSEVRRLGDSIVRRYDFRLVAATNRELASEVAEGRFRADLWYRLDGLRIDMPPLAERKEDVPELVQHFLRQDAARTGVRRRIAPAVMERLASRAWPGNVRELANEVARLCVLSEGDLADPDLVREPASAMRVATSGSGLQSLADLEREAILAALEQCGGDKRKAAELLGISRAKIYQRLKEYRGE